MKPTMTGRSGRRRLFLSVFRRVMTVSFPNSKVFFVPEPNRTLTVTLNFVWRWGILAALSHARLYVPAVCLGNLFHNERSRNKILSLTEIKFSAESSNAGSTCTLLPPPHPDTAPLPNSSTSACDFFQDQSTSFSASVTSYAVCQEVVGEPPSCCKARTSRCCWQHPHAVKWS